MKKIIAVAVTTVSMVMLGSVPASSLYVIGDSWSMVPNGSDVIDEISGSNRDGTVIGSGADWDAFANGLEIDGASVLVEVANSGDDSPETRSFAMGAIVRSDSVAGRDASYSGNVIQKGNYGSVGQIKLSIVKDDSGTFECRFKGATTNYLVRNDEVVNVDDGSNHSAYCWHDNGEYGLNVDGQEDIDTQSSVDIGTVSPSNLIRMGNKSDVGGVNDQFFGRYYCVAYSHGNNSVPFVDDTLNTGC